MVAAKTCSSCKKLFDAKDIRNNLCEKCLATQFNSIASSAASLS